MKPLKPLLKAGQLFMSQAPKIAQHYAIVCTSILATRQSFKSTFVHTTHPTAKHAK